MAAAAAALSIEERDLIRFINDIVVVVVFYCVLAASTFEREHTRDERK
jgi:hypothetical protein